MLMINRLSQVQLETRQRNKPSKESQAKKTSDRESTHIRFGECWRQSVIALEVAAFRITLYNLDIFEHIVEGGRPVVPAQNKVKNGLEQRIQKVEISTCGNV